MTIIMTSRSGVRTFSRFLVGILPQKGRFISSSSAPSTSPLWHSSQNRVSSKFINLSSHLNIIPIRTCSNARAAVKSRMNEIGTEDLSQEQKEIEERKRERGSVQEYKQYIPSVEETIASDPAFQSPDYFQVHNLFTVRDLLDARVHLGHKLGSLNSRMNDFIFGSRFDSVIFDLDKTAFHLRQALNFTAHIAYKKGIIMFVTRYPQSIHLVERTAVECGEYAHCREWHPHILTNSENKFGGITRLPDLIILMSTLDSVLAPHGAVYDSNKMLIPTVGIVDSNCDPARITYPVPGNDDTSSAVEFYCKVFKEAIMRGKQKRRSLELSQNRQQQEEDDKEKN